MKFGLSESVIQHLTKIFSSHAEIERAQMFGSRAMGNYRPNSDIDIVLFGDIDEMLLAKIYAELEELPLPYLIDLKAYNDVVNSPLSQHIDQYGQDFYIK